MPLKPLPSVELPEYEIGDAIPIKGWVVKKVERKENNSEPFYKIDVENGQAEVNCYQSGLENMVGVYLKNVLNDGPYSVRLLNALVDLLLEKVKKESKSVLN